MTTNKTGIVEPTRALTQEEMEMLKTLEASPYWKFYQRLLMKSKDAYFNSILPMTDPNQVLKHVGIVAGINFAINSLQVLCMENDKQRQLLVEKSTKVDVPFKRG
jgi:hypothetical protein